MKTIHTSRKPWTIIVLAIFILTLFHCQAPDSSPSFRFAFMTDIHITRDRNAYEGFQKAIEHANAMRPKIDFVITGGDLIMDALDAKHESADSLYNLYKESISNFKMPVYNGIGNHEFFGVYRRDEISSQHPDFAEKMFLHKLDRQKPYSSFDHKGWHFVLLKSIGITPERSYIGEVDTEQLAWLAEDLRKIDKDTPVVLALHIPLFTAATQIRSGSTTANGRGTVVTNAKDVMDILQPYNFRLALQGHLHIVEEIIWQKMHFITGGAVSASWWEGPYYDFEEGFVVVDVKGSDFNWHYETYDWDVEK
jgi:Icc protein